MKTLTGTDRLKITLINETEDGDMDSVTCVLKREGTEGILVWNETYGATYMYPWHRVHVIEVTEE